MSGTLTGHPVSVGIGWGHCQAERLWSSRFGEGASFLTKGSGWLWFGVARQRVESLFFVGLEQGTFLDGDVALSVHVGIKVRKSESPIVG